MKILNLTNTTQTHTKTNKGLKTIKDFLMSKMPMRIETIKRFSTALILGKHSWEPLHTDGEGISRKRNRGHTMSEENLTSVPLGMAGGKGHWSLLCGNKGKTESDTHQLPL